MYTRNALHQLPDVWKGVALHRLAGILRPGGVLRLHDLVYDCDPGELGALVERWRAGAPTDPDCGYTADDLATHVRTEFGTYTWLLEPLLLRAGFTVHEATVRQGVYATYTCLRT